MENEVRHIGEGEKRLVTVGIPLYTLKLSETELLALRQCFKVLGHHDIAIIKPKSLDLSPLPEMIGDQSPTL